MNTTLHVLKPWTAKARDTLQIRHIDVSWVTVIVLEKGAHLPFSSGAVWFLTATLFSGLGSEEHFTGEEFGMQWQDYLFELQNAAKWRMVMSRGPGERAQMHSMSYLLSTCEDMSNQELIDDGAAWIQQGKEQEQRDRAAGVKALFNMLAKTTSSRANDLVKQRLERQDGMIAFGRVPERCGKTVGVAKLTDVFQFQWISSDSLEGKWMKWVKLMRQVSVTLSGDGAREALTIAGLRTPQTWVVLCASVDQYLRTTADSITAQPTTVEMDAVVSTCASCGESGHDKSKGRMRDAKCSICEKSWISQEDVQTT